MEGTYFGEGCVFRCTCVGRGGSFQPRQSAYFTDFTRTVKTVGYSSARRSKKEQNKLIWRLTDLFLHLHFHKTGELVEMITTPCCTYSGEHFHRHDSGTQSHRLPGACHPLLQMRRLQLTGAKPSSPHACGKQGHKDYSHLTHREPEQLKDFLLSRKEQGGPG